jgi:hypothetical protein
MVSFMEKGKIYPMYLNIMRQKNKIVFCLHVTTFSVESEHSIKVVVNLKKKKRNHQYDLFCI